MAGLLSGKWKTETAARIMDSSNRDDVRKTIDMEMDGLENVQMNSNLMTKHSPIKLSFQNNEDEELNSVDDRIEAEVIMSSPHFRPANMAEIENAMSNQASQQEQQQTKQNPRKSLGRRVSFAATAHVRLFEREEDDNDGAIENDEAASTPDSPISAPQKFSPVRLNEDNDRDRLLSLVHSPTPHFNPSKASIANPSNLRLSITTEQMRSPTSSTRESAGSFDIDLKDTNSSSFTSYISGCEDNDEDVMPPIVNEEDVDMDFTGCVGGILKEAGSTLNEHKSEDHAMDMTVCVGGIIKRFDLQQPDIPASPASSVDTMELTECVGLILARQERQRVGNPPEDNPAAPINNAAEVDMDMTVCVTNTIIQQQQHQAEEAVDHVSSPSPFLLPNSPRMNNCNSLQNGPPFLTHFTFCLP